jgi:alanine racemase
MGPAVALFSGMPPAYPVSEIAEILGAARLGTCPDGGVDHLLFDSRRLVNAPRTLFFSLTGPRNDGHRYLGELYAQGVRNFVVSRTEGLGEFPDACFLLVNDVLAALQQLAKVHRGRFGLPVIGITGSNGKTVVKEWLWQLLSVDRSVVRSPKSYNSQIGVPVSVWQIGPGHELGIFEAGISRPGEMARLADIIACDIGLFTNIGDAHNEGFPDRETKVREKSLLFASARRLVYCRDHALVAKVLSERYPDREHHAWSFEDPDARFFLQGLPFSDRASCENALHCAFLMRLLGYGDETIAERLAQLRPLELRLEAKVGINSCVLINDAYSADVLSLGIALDFLVQQSPSRRRTVVLSDLLETGRSPQLLYREVAELLVQKKVDRLVAIGPEIAGITAHLPRALRAQTECYPDTAAFLRLFEPERFREETILVKGARSFAFERVVRLLERKAHRTVLEIHLDALGHNLNIYRGLVGPSVKVMCMVKAAGYGSGSHEVARYLQYLGADYLAVAYADEGVELRQAGVETPILVLNPEENGFEAMVRYRLEPEMYSLPLLKNWTFFFEKHFSGKKIPVHLKLDTGMHRLGFEENDLPELLEWLGAHPALDIKSLFSHLVASDAPQHDGFTEAQARRFEQMSGQIAGVLGKMPLRHLLNSGGIARHPAYRYDMVRLGIGLYGIDGSALIQDRLMPVSTLKATISQVKNVPKGDTVGYDRKGQVHRDSRIATISIGYADGFDRRLGNGVGKVLLRGQRVPVIGNVCMDMAMVDITDVPHAGEGDEVVVFGPGLSVREMAEWLGTIPYEVLTNVSERVTRVCVAD